VMPFGLTNALPVFLNFMNDVLRTVHWGLLPRLPG
jgi:hypothetical protein